MTTRSQKRKAVERLVSGNFDTSTAENNVAVDLVAGLSKSPRRQSGNLDEIETLLRHEVISDLTKIFAENQKEMLN